MMFWVVRNVTNVFHYLKVVVSQLKMILDQEGLRLQLMTTTFRKPTIWYVQIEWLSKKLQKNYFQNELWRDNSLFLYQARTLSFVK